MAPVHERQRHPLAVSMLSVLLGTASVASAGIYPGHLDPGGNGFVPAFNADVLFSVENNCIESGTYWQPTPGRHRALTRAVLRHLPQLPYIFTASMTPRRRTRPTPPRCKTPCTSTDPLL